MTVPIDLSLSKANATPIRWAQDEPWQSVVIFFFSFKYIVL